MRKTSSILSTLTLLSLVIFAALSQAQNTIVTFAGGGPNNLPALSSSIGQPSGIAEDSAGNLFFADAMSNRIFKVDTVGNLTVVAGNGVAAFAGDGGLAINAELNGPAGIFVDNSGDLFIADEGNSIVREVYAGTGIITTVAGTPNVFAYGGDGAAATNAYLYSP